MPTSLPPFPTVPSNSNSVTIRTESNTGGGSGSGTPGPLPFDPTDSERARGITSSMKFRQMQAKSTSRALLNNAARPAIELQQPGSAENWAPPIVYGEAIVPGHILAWKVTDSTLYLSVGWALGGSSGIDSIVQIYNDHAPIPEEITVTNYLGTTGQTADATLAAQIAGYVDTNVGTINNQSVGVAYSVIVIPTGVLTRPPSLTAKIKGLKTNAGAWSDNPAHALADFVGSSLYGQARTVNAASITTAATRCDNDLGGGHKRCTIGLVINQSRSTDDWVDVLRAYALCFVIARGTESVLVPDAPGASARSFTMDDFRADDNLVLSKRALDQSPTVVTVIYTDTSSVPWRDKRCVPSAKLSGVDDGTTPIRESVVRLPGIQSNAMAYRFAAQYLNAANLVDLDAVWGSFDDQLDIEIGDIVDVTHDYGLSAKTMRVTDIRPGGRIGTWTITAAEHTDLIYSDDVVNTSSPSDTNLPLPTNPPAVASVTITEAIFTDQADRVASRFSVSWAGVDWPYAGQYRVTVTGSGMNYVALETHLGAAETHDIETPAIKQGVEYVAKVQTISLTGHRSSVTSSMATGLGKLIPPSAPTSLAGFEAGQFVSLTWDSVIDIGIVKYRIKRGTTSDTWESATVPAGGKLLASTNFLDRAVPAGTYRYFVKAIDDVALESATAATTDIVVTADEAVAALTASAGGGSLTLVNMHRYDVDGDARYVITDGGETLASKFATTLDSFTGTKLAKNHGLSAGAATVESSAVDLGSDRNGDFSYNATIDTFGIGAVATQKIQTATAAAHPTFTEYAGSAVVAIARYYRFKIIDDGGTDARIIRVRFPVNQQFIGKSIVNSGSASIPASGQPLSVTFSSAYITTPRVTVTPTGSSPRIIAADNITTTAFDLYSWNTSGAAAAGTCTWEANGT